MFSLSQSIIVTLRLKCIQYVTVYAISKFIWQWWRHAVYGRTCCYLTSTSKCLSSCHPNHTKGKVWTWKSYLCPQGQLEGDNDEQKDESGYIPLSRWRMASATVLSTLLHRTNLPLHIKFKFISVQLSKIQLKSNLDSLAGCKYQQHANLLCIFHVQMQSCAIILFTIQ